jgi:hypothetical protein
LLKKCSCGHIGVAISSFAFIETSKLLSIIRKYREVSEMRISILLFLIVLILSPSIAFSESGHEYKSKYIGQEKRSIKSLSESDINELKNGKGWGLAKAAELNGVPGPVHLLEMKDEISLTDEQVKKIDSVYQKMKMNAVELGEKLIGLEFELNAHFANRTINDNLLMELLAKIEDTHKKLRYIHLSAHLETPLIVSEKQIKLYNKLRGYENDDPCENIPDGHDSEMWKRHNNCQ